MVSQARLARQFARGARSGRASSVKIREIEDGTALVDTRGRYAVLAYRYPSGQIVAFEGWYGYSTSTSCMMTKMGISPACRHDEHREYIAHATSADKVVVGTLVKWLHENDPTCIGMPNPTRRY